MPPLLVFIALRYVNRLKMSLTMSFIVPDNLSAG